MSLRKNTIWNIVGSGIPLIAAVIFIPFMLNRLGSEAFGLLTLVWALIGYFSLFDLGIGKALTYELSRLQHANKLQEISYTLKSGLTLTALTGALGAIFLLLIAPNLVYKWLKISFHIQADALLAFQIAAFGIIPTTITSGLRGALEGLERFSDSNINKILLGSFTFIIPAISIELHGNQLSYIAIYLVAIRLIAALLGIISLKSHIYSANNRISFKILVANIKPLLNYGFWISVTSVIGPLMVYGDRFFVSAAVGAIFLPLYAIPQEGLQRLLLIPTALSAALLPKFSSTKSIELIQLYLKSYKLMTLVMFFITVIAGILMHPLLTRWISKEFADQTLWIGLTLCIGIFLNGVSLLPYTFIHANGNPKITAYFHLIELLLYIVLIWQLTYYFGILGAAIAWVVRVAIDLFLLHIAASNIIKKFTSTNKLQTII